MDRGERGGIEGQRSPLSVLCQSFARTVDHVFVVSVTCLDQHSGTACAALSRHCSA